MRMYTLSGSVWVRFYVGIREYVPVFKLKLKPHTEAIFLYFYYVKAMNDKKRIYYTHSLISFLILFNCSGFVCSLAPFTLSFHLTSTSFLCVSFTQDHNSSKNFGLFTLFASLHFYSHTFFSPLANLNIMIRIYTYILYICMLQTIYKWPECEQTKGNWMAKVLALDENVKNILSRDAQFNRIEEIINRSISIVNKPKHHQQQQ